MRSKKAFYNIIASLVLEAVTVICGFVIPKYIIKEYGSDVNGLISSIAQFLAYISLLEAGFGPVVKAALYKPIASKDKEQIKKILKASERFFRIIALIFVGYLILLSFTYPLIVNTEFTFWYTFSLVIIISISTLAEYYFGITYKLYLQAEQKTYITSIIQIIGYILNTSAIIILIKCNCSIHIVKLVSGIIFVLRPLAQNIYVKKKYKIDLKDVDKKFEIEQKWDGLAQHIASVIYSNTDVVILTIFAPITEVSVYNIYYLVIKGINALIEAISKGTEASFGDMIAKGEKQHLNKSFSVYELFYFTMITILYVCAILLIVPFEKVYTNGITDANYIRPLFGVLLVISQFVWAIRLPYSRITSSAGHFKETKKGAWVEAISNVVISLIFVWKLGIVGVTIGTLIAMLIRTIEFVYHANKYILERKNRNSIKRIFIATLETIVICVICYFIPKFEINSYYSWIKISIITLFISTLVVIPTNFIVYKNDVNELLKVIKRIITKKSNKKVDIA